MPAKNITIDTLSWEVEERSAGVHAARMVIIDAAGKVLGGTAPLLVTIDPNSAGIVKDDEGQQVLAGANNVVLGTTGAAGDYFSHILVVPTTTSPGAITIRDGATGTVRTYFAGGASSVTSLVSWAIPVRERSVTGGWHITTGANLTVQAVGNFT